MDKDCPKCQKDVYHNEKYVCEQLVKKPDFFIPKLIPATSPSPVLDYWKCQSCKMVNEQSYKDDSWCKGCYKNTYQSTFKLDPVTDEIIIGVNNAKRWVCGNCFTKNPHDLKLKACTKCKQRRTEPAQGNSLTCEVCKTNDVSVTIS